MMATYAPESEGASLWRLDEDTGSYVAYSRDQFSGLAIGLGSVWATSIVPESGSTEGFVGYLNQIEPASGATLARIEGDRWDWDEMFVATDAGMVWTASAFGDIRFPDHHVTGFDPVASEVVTEFTIDFTITDFAAGEGALWVTHPDADTIARIDSATGQSDPGDQSRADTGEARCRRGGGLGRQRAGPRRSRASTLGASTSRPSTSAAYRPTSQPAREPCG